MRNRFQTLNIVFHNLGSLLYGLAGIILIPLVTLFAWGGTEDIYLTSFAFVFPSLLAGAGGFFCRKYFSPGRMRGLQAMLICSLAWISFSLIGALPFVFIIGSSYLDAVFETMSGFTTTGITMFSGLDGMPRSILFWRSLTQWVGGLGILTFFLAISFRGKTAHRLFGAESHKFERERPVPGLANTLLILWSIYILFTLVITSGLTFSGMSVFDSVCHTFTALSTGGFSPHDISIDYYRAADFPHYVLIEYILIIGMLIGGMNFLIHYRILMGKFKAIYDNTEMRYWWGLIGIFVLIIFIERTLRSGGFWRNLESNFRAVLFQVVSILTTTGFATRDIAGQFFGRVARQLFLVMMVIGGCVGSTGGGFKVLRTAILTKSVWRELFRLRSSSRTINDIIIDGKLVKINEVRRVGALFFAWILLLAIGGVITTVFSRLDGYSSFSGMFSALGNIGPCYITVDQMGDLNPLVKLTYIFGMLAGRLEILPVLLLFSPRAWRG